MLALAGNALDSVSRAVDEVSLRLLALRRGKLILLKDVLPAESLLEVLGDLCRGRICLARVAAGDVDGSLLVYRGTVVAAYSKVGELESSGTASFKELLARLSLSGGKVTVYEIPPEELSSRYPDLVKSIEEGVKLRPPVEAPTPAPPREVPKDLDKELAEAVRALGLPIASTSISVEEGRAVIRASWAGQPRYPLSIVLAAVKVLSEKGQQVRRIELVSEGRAVPSALLPIPTRPRIALSFDPPEAMKVVAAVAEICLKRGFYVEELDYKLRKGSLSLRLDVVVPYSRVAGVSPDTYGRIPKELAEETRRKLLELLGGKVEVRVSATISTIQGYVEYEGKAP